MAAEKPSLTHTAAIVLLAALVVFAFLERQDRQPDRTISVSGSAEHRTAPDLVEARVRVESLADRPTDAESLNTQRSNAVIAALRSLGIGEADIKTESYDLREVTEYNPRTGEVTVTGYEAVHVLSARTKQLPLAGRIIQEAVDAGATGVDSVRFMLSPEAEKAAKAELLAKAAADARAKAQGIAAGLGVRLGRPVSVTEQSFGFIPFRAEAAALDKGVPAPEFQPGEVEVSGQVSVSFRIS
jgi:hypothetical protein